MRWMWFAFLLTAAGCGGGDCTQAALNYCDQCPQPDNDFNCPCVEDGKLTKADAPDGYFETDADAQRWCDENLIYLRDASPESQAYCNAQDDILSQIGVDACDDIGSGYYDYTGN